MCYYPVSDSIRSIISMNSDNDRDCDNGNDNDSDNDKCNGGATVLQQ